MSSTTRGIIQKFMDHITACEFVEAFGLLNKDGKYIVIGKTPASGVYHGPEDIYARLLPVLAAFPTPPQLTFGDVVVEGDKGMIRAAGTGVGPTGNYDQPYYVWSVRVEGDGFAEMIEFLDTAELEAAAFGKDKRAA